MKRMEMVPDLAFGEIELFEYGEYEANIPSWLVDREDVLLELLRIARAGGREELKRIAQRLDHHAIGVPEPPDITREELFAEIDRLLKIEKIAQALTGIPMPQHMMSDQNPHYVLIMELYGALHTNRPRRTKSER